jgi:hypothetical protein
LVGCFFYLCQVKKRWRENFYGELEKQDGKRVKKVELKVNGKEVFLNPFTNLIIENTIWGMVSSLKLEEEPKKLR